MAASTVEIAAAILIPPPVLFDRWQNGQPPESPNQDDAGNPAKIFPPGGPDKFPPVSWSFSWKEAPARGQEASWPDSFTV